MNQDHPPLSAEQRHKPRTPVDFWAVVRGVTEEGKRFQKNAQIKNLSAGGLYLHLDEPVTSGIPLFVLFRFAPTPGTPALQVAARGVVRHVAPQPDGGVGIGFMFHQHRTV